MDPSEVGKKIKEMYPEYAQYNDAVVGQRYILKYGDKGLQALGLGTADTGEQQANATKLRKEFNTETKSLGFKEVESTWNKVQEAGETGAGDLTIVYSYIKALDPTTAVREGEINLTKAAESIPSNIIRAYKRAKEGKVISPELRQEMISEIGNIYNEKARSQKELNTYYSGLAMNSNIEPEDVIGGVGDVQMAEIPQYAPPREESLQEKIGGAALGVGKSLASPFVTTGKNVGLLGQTALFNILKGAGAKKQAQAVARGGFQEQAKKYSERPEAAVAEQLGASAELMLPKLLKAAAPTIKGGAKVAAKGAKTATNVRGTLKAKEVAKAAESATKVKQGPFVKAAKKYIESDPEAAKILEKTMPAIKSLKTPSQLLERLDVWKRAYTQAGKAGKTSRAGLFNTLYQEGLKELQRTAPAAKKIRSLEKLSYDLPKTAKKVAWYGTLGRILGGGL